MSQQPLWWTHIYGDTRTSTPIGSLPRLGTAPERESARARRHRRVVAQFVEARTHIDLVIEALLAAESGRPRTRTPGQPDDGMFSVSASIAESISALDIAFEKWLDSQEYPPT